MICARAGLAVVWLMLSAAPAVAAAKAPHARPRPVTPTAILGWGTALLALAGAAWAASLHVAPSAQDRAERERIKKLLASLERAQRARLDERERHGLRRRRPSSGEGAPGASPARFDGGFSFRAGARSGDRSGPTPPEVLGAPPPPTPPARPAPQAQAQAQGREAATKKGEEQLALLLEAIAAAERRLEVLRADLDQAAPQGSFGRTLNLGPLDMPGGATLDLGALEVPDEVLERLRVLSEVAVSDGTVDLGPLELPGAGTMVVLPQDLLARLRALSGAPVPEGALSCTIDLGPLDLPAA